MLLNFRTLWLSSVFILSPALALSELNVCHPSGATQYVPRCAAEAEAALARCQQYCYGRLETLTMAAAGVQIPEIEFLFQIVEIEKKKLERYQEDKTRPCEGVTGTKCGHCCCELLPSTMAEQLTARSLENMQSHIAKFIKRSKANP